MTKSIEERLDDIEIMLKGYVPRQEHRWHLLKDRVDIVYDRLVMLANTESQAEINKVEAEKIYNEIRKIGKDVNLSLSKEAGKILQGKSMKY